MKIAVIGAGNVGATLGRRWAKAGHEIVFGVRDPHHEKMQHLIKSIGRNAAVDSIDKAVVVAEVVVLATPWEAAQEVIRTAGNLVEKIVIDCTNPLKEDLSGLSVGFATSAAEQIANWAKGAKVVKAFNTIGSKNMANPVYGSDKITMFICGDDREAKKIVSQLADELGFHVVDTGALMTARYLEPMAMLWIHMAFAGGYGEDFAFKMLKR